MATDVRAWLAYRNLADAGVVTATSALASMPTSLLQDPHIARRWRGRTGTEAVIVDLGTVASVDTVMLAGLNLSLAGSGRVRVSTADSSGQAGDAYDAAVPSGAIDPAYGMLVHLMPALAAGRFVRIDLTDPAATYVEAGRLFVGPGVRFATNFAYGWSRGWADRSRKTEGRGGQTFVDPDNAFRVLDLTFEAVTPTERNSFVEELDRVNGAHVDVLAVTDPTSTNLGRDSVWGLADDVSPVAQPYFANFSKSYKIKERL